MAVEIDVSEYLSFSEEGRHEVESFLRDQLGVDPRNVFYLFIDGNRAIVKEYHESEFGQLHVGADGEDLAIVLRVFTRKRQGAPWHEVSAWRRN